MTKQAAMDLFEEFRAEYLAEARAAAVQIARENGVCTVNDVREVCPPPSGIDPRVMGAIFSGRLWNPVGYVNSSRRTCHGRVIRQFEYVG